MDVLRKVSIIRVPTQTNSKHSLCHISNSDFYLYIQKYI